MTRKGNGLKKWRRIKRDSNKVGDGSVHIGNDVALDMSDSGPNPSKKIFSQRMQKSRGSVSSMNAAARSLDDFALTGYSGIDMENGQIGNSKSSSTKASSPIIRSETSAVVEFPPDMIREGSFSGEKFTESTPLGQQGKGRIGTRNNSEGKKINIEKENSHSSVESDLQSSNFVFMQGTCSTSNGIRSERSTDYDGDNENEVQDIQQKVDNVLQDGEVGYNDYSPEHMSDDSSREIKRGNQNNGSSTDLDPMAESTVNLESVKEALEKEVLKFREIRQDVFDADPVLDLPAEFAYDRNPQEATSEPSQSVDGAHRFSFFPQSEVLEIEYLFMQKIKAEVEYLVTQRAFENFRVAVVDQITILEEQKALASKQTQILNKLGDTEKKAVMLNKEAEKLEKFCEDIASADETLKLQNRVCKYTTCFFMQLVLLALVLGLFMFQLSPKFVDNIPT